MLVGLDWREDVAIDRGLRRPTDLAVSRGNRAKAMERLGWVESIRLLIRSSLKLQNISKFMPLYLVILVRMIG